MLEQISEPKIDVQQVINYLKNKKGNNLAKDYPQILKELERYEKNYRKNTRKKKMIFQVPLKKIINPLMIERS